MQPKKAAKKASATKVPKEVPEPPKWIEEQSRATHTVHCPHRAPGPRTQCTVHTVHLSSRCMADSVRRVWSSGQEAPRERQDVERAETQPRVDQVGTVAVMREKESESEG